MADENAAELRAIVAQVRSEQKGPFPRSLQVRLLRYASERWKSGKTIPEVATELGVSGHTLSYWRARLSGRNESVLKPVKVVAERADVRRHFSVAGPCGTSVEALTLDEVAELFRKLK